MNVQIFSFSVLSALCLATAPCSTAADVDPFVCETPQEFFLRGDFDGNGKTDSAIVDKETGKYRLGFQGEGGAMNWVDNRPSGLRGVTGAAIGRLLTDKTLGLVLTSADANQICFIDISSPAVSAKPQTLPFSAAMGPTAVVAVDAGGENNTPLADLVVASIYNSPEENLVSVLRNDLKDLPKLDEQTQPGVVTRATRLALDGSKADLVAILVPEKDGSSLRICALGSGKLTQLAAVDGLPQGADYLTGRFSKPGNDLIVYKPGESRIFVRHLTIGADDRVTATSPKEYDLGQPLLRVMTLAHPAGNRLLAVLGEGQKAAVLSFDGSTVPTPVYSITATNELFTAGIAVGENCVMFTRAAEGKFSYRYHSHLANGNGYSVGPYGNLPTLADNDNLIIPDIHGRIVTKGAPQDDSGMTRYTNTIPGTRVSFVMVPIKGGEFLMGSPESEPDRKPDEGPQQKVSISPFWMGQCEITWNEYELFMYPDVEKRTRGTVPTDEEGDKLADAVTHPSKPYVEMSFGMGKDGFPAISMTQHAANKYCQWLSAKTGHFYRLPTEAEWEYACRAGTTTAYYFGDDPAQLKDHSWFEENSDFKYQKVGKKKPNPWGLHDMAGNVVEWVIDQYDPETYGKAKNGIVAVDPWLKATKPYPHSVRGGSWDDPPDRLRSAARRGSDRAWKMQDPQLPKSIWFFSDAQFVGFRVVRPLKIPPPEEMQKFWSSGVERD